ncbi:hypothetical protein [Cellulomonas sp. URHD0024]|uniref:hypothetical protein n=1 Tax=Cellulomonas sp. URHD0024 TaxID=1302620 RepID=UPI00040B5258|nr:hypothetical protein [Cellulomonas sp. URHD0024]
MANTALRCTDPACAAQGKVQTSKTCAVCGKPTVWTVLRVPQPGAPAPIGPIYTSPMPLKGSAQPVARPVGVETRTCMDPQCARYRLAQDDPFCGACGTATVPATTR